MVTGSAAVFALIALLGAALFALVREMGRLSGGLRGSVEHLCARIDGVHGELATLTVAVRTQGVEMSHGFEVLGGRVDVLTGRLDVQSDRIDVLAERLDIQTGRIVVLVDRDTLLEQRIGALEAKVAGIEQVAYQPRSRHSGSDARSAPSVVSAPCPG